MSSFGRLQMAIVDSSVVNWFFTAFGLGIFRFLFCSPLMFALGFAVTTLAFIIQRSLEDVERVRLDMHRQRGGQFSPPTPQSIEWLDAFNKTIWGLVDPDVYVSVTDMIKDVM
ncbi:hypothetical protein FRC12_020172 [Ceratobasidium sp. 428]|nr:hypothetical protein FRC12_020172 [Ceratobasidium sp. 428]